MKKLYTFMAVIMAAAFVLSACGPAATPAPAPTLEPALRKQHRLKFLPPRRTLPFPICYQPLSTRHTGHLNRSGLSASI